MINELSKDLEKRILSEKKISSNIKVIKIQQINNLKHEVDLALSKLDEILSLNENDPLESSNYINDLENLEISFNNTMEKINKLKNKSDLEQLFYVKTALKSEVFFESNKISYNNFERKFDIISELSRFAKDVSLLIFYKINNISVKKYLNSIKLSQIEKKLVDKILRKKRY